jgi:hypothetical protein
MVRLDSRSADPLQMADLLTAAVAFEFRQHAGLAGARSPKARLADHVRTIFNVSSFRDPPPGDMTSRLSVRMYRDAEAEPTDDGPVTADLPRQPGSARVPA